MRQKFWDFMTIFSHVLKIDNSNSLLFDFNNFLLGDFGKSLKIIFSYC